MIIPPEGLGVKIAVRDGFNVYYSVMENLLFEYSYFDMYSERKNMDDS
jgi:hypothetical protein